MTSQTKTKKLKSSSDAEIMEVIQNGGIAYIDGVRVFVDNPRNFNIVEAASGYWITNAMGFKTYFKVRNGCRVTAQNACDVMFGKGRYKVNSRV